MTKPTKKNSPKSNLAVKSDLAKFTVVELKAKASKEGIKIKPGTKKDGIIALLIDNKVKLTPKEKSPAKVKITKEKSPVKKSSTRYSPGSLKGKKVPDLRKICKDLGIEDCLGSKYINQKDLIAILQKYQENIDVKEKSLEKKEEKIEEEKKKVEKEKKELKEEKKKVEKEKKIVLAVASGELPPSDLKCLDRTKCKGSKPICDTDDGECKGSRYQGPKGKGYKVDKNYKIVGPSDVVDKHIDWWTKKPSPKKPSPKKLEKVKYGRCNEKENPKPCGEKEVCFKGVCKDKSKIDNLNKKYVLKVDGRTIVSETKAGVEKLQKLLGGEIQRRSCDDLDFPARCDEDDVCYKSKCTKKSSIGDLSKKYVLKVDGRTIVSDTKEEIQQLQHLLGGDIIEQKKEEEPSEEEITMEEETSSEEEEEESSEEEVKEEEVKQKMKIIEEEKEEEKEEEPSGELTEKKVSDIRNKFAKCLAEM